MLLLPKTIGPITLVRKLGTGGVAESYYGTLQGSRKREVVVRRVLPYILTDRARLRDLELRVRDLLGLDHPHLVRMVEWIVDGKDRYIVEECVEGIDLARLLKWCKANNERLPPNVFLNLATQICNGLEALHGTRGRGSGASSVLHLGLKPTSVFVNAEGQVLLGGYGLSPSPTLLPQGGKGGSPVPFRMEYLSPEQTQGELKPSPASDIFSLGTILYELLTLSSLFRSETSLQTIERIRRAEITSHLLEVRDLMPGLDKVLYRALSLKPQHRYQRAFVMREDLRALMSGYSFSSISQDARAYLEPLFSGSGTAVTGLGEETTGSLEAVGSSPPVQDHTMARIAQAIEVETERVLATDESSSDEGMVDRAPDAPASQDSFDEEIETIVNESPEPLMPPQILSWDTETDTAEFSDELTGEMTSESTANEPSASLTLGQPLPSIQMPPPPTPEPPQAPPSRVLRNIVGGPHLQKEPSAGPRTVDQIAGTPGAPPPNRTQNRQANEALRSIREAARSEVTEDDSDSDIYAWKKRQSVTLTAASAVGGVLLIFACAGIVFWGLGGLIGEEPEAPTSSKEDKSEEVSPLPESDVATELAANSSQPENLEENVALEPTEGGPDSLEAPDLADPAEASTAQDQHSPMEGHREPLPSETEDRESRARSTDDSRSSRSRTTNEEDSLSSYEVSQDAIVSSVLDSPEGFEPEAQVDLDWDYYVRRAERGSLTPSDQIALESVPRSQEAAFSRSRALLLMHAQYSRDDRATKLYLEQLFLVPENRYNPVFLTAQAQLQVNQQRYEAALSSASKAELRWQDIPSALIVEKLAEIYEVKARSYQGLFYQSEDLDDLDEAMSAWKKYRDHVSRHSRGDLLARADLEMSKLQDARSRME